MLSLFLFLQVASLWPSWQIADIAKRRNTTNHLCAYRVLSSATPHFAICDVSGCRLWLYKSFLLSLHNYNPALYKHCLLNQTLVKLTQTPFRLDPVLGPCPEGKESCQVSLVRTLTLCIWSSVILIKFLIPHHPSSDICSPWPAISKNTVQSV